MLFQPQPPSFTGDFAMAYCGQPCQVQHWRAEHKHECAAMAAAAAGEAAADA